MSVTIPDSISQLDFESSWESYAAAAAGESDPVGWLAALGFWGGYELAHVLKLGVSKPQEDQAKKHLQQTSPQIANVFAGYTAAIRANAYVQGGIYVKLHNEFGYLYKHHIPTTATALVRKLTHYTDQVARAIRRELYTTRHNLRTLHHFAHMQIRQIRGQVIPRAEHKLTRERHKGETRLYGHITKLRNGIEEQLTVQFKVVWAQLKGTTQLVKTIQTQELPAIRQNVRELQHETQVVLPHEIEVAELETQREVKHAEELARGLVTRAEELARNELTKARAESQAEVKRAEAISAEEVQKAEQKATADIKAAEKQAQQLVTHAEQQAEHLVETAEQRAKHALEVQGNELKTGIALSQSQAEGAATSQFVPIAEQVGALALVVGKILKRQEECLNPMCRSYKEHQGILKKLEELGSTGSVLLFAEEIIREPEVAAKLLIGGLTYAAPPLVDMATSLLQV